jgi:hypothetical protein
MLYSVETRAPTYYRHVLGDDGAPRQAEEYSRLMLPMWGEGHVGMLLGVVGWG